ncbi:polysaccharide pyruvyl transferase CsaB [Synechococcus sp. KORDI-52]|uniref:polysaccharide pyruvyl transferase CsaB n=1 Tax=Synechococcus sp. KORDI-52 TaxID=585425 RepID=UPI00056F4DE5|nr:polysaccharide pyruvyl transferase CsaB [Synechococcus sp. KORDI-52]
MVRPTAPVLLLCGYYGEHNLGDDALLQVLVSSLPQPQQLLITARDPAPVLALAPSAQTVNRRSLLLCVRAALRADVLVLGGGSLLQDSTSFSSLVYYLLLMAVARLGGAELVLWGQGLGPLQHRISRLLVRTVLPFCTAASWRDQRSFDWAQRWAPRLPSVLAVDPVWQMPARPWIGGDAIVLSWRPTPLLDHLGWRRLTEALDRLSAELDVPVIWLAFHEHQDAPLLQRLSDEGLLPMRLKKRSSTLVPQSLEAVFDLVQRARLVLPMRLHALILARLANSPMAALSYDPKVEAAAAMAKVPCVALTSVPSLDDLLALWRDQVDRPADPDQTEALRRQASAHSELLNRMAVDVR